MAGDLNDVDQLTSPLAARGAEAKAQSYPC